MKHVQQERGTGKCAAELEWEFWALVLARVWVGSASDVGCAGDSSPVELSWEAM